MKYTFNWFRNTLKNWSKPLAKPVDPMDSVGRFQIRCDDCGKSFRASSRFARACTLCRFDNAFLRNVPRGLRVEI